MGLNNHGSHNHGHRLQGQTEKREQVAGLRQEHVLLSVRVLWCCLPYLIFT